MGGGGSMEQHPRQPRSSDVAPEHLSALLGRASADSVVLPVESSKRDANSNRTHLLSPYYATVSVLKVLLD